MKIKSIIFDIIDKDSNKVEPDKNGCICMLPSYKCVARIIYDAHVRMISVHWWTHTSFQKICPNLKYKKPYQIHFGGSPFKNRKFNCKQASHKYRHRWKDALL